MYRDIYLAYWHLPWHVIGSTDNYCTRPYTEMRLDLTTRNYSPAYMYLALPRPTCIWAYTYTYLALPIRT